MCRVLVLCLAFSIQASETALTPSIGLMSGARLGAALGQAGASKYLHLSCQLERAAELSMCCVRRSAEPLNYAR